MLSQDFSPAPEHIEELSETASFSSNTAPTTGQNTPSKRPTGPRLAQLAQLGSPRFSSNSSVLSSTTRASRFDERIQSRFSLLSRLHRNVAEEDTQKDSDYKDPLTPQEHTQTRITDLKWIKMNTLNTLVRSSHSKAVYGDPTCIAVGDVVTLGTTKGHVLVFDFRQILIAALGKGTGATTWGLVTCVTLSLDSTHLAVGYESGDVLIWDLKIHVKPKIHIEPLNEINTVSDGHIKGSPINNIAFIGKRHTVLATTDINGMVMYHQCNRGILGFAVTTRRILGKYEEIEPSKCSAILACESLPLGTSVEHMDAQGLIAIMTTSSLLVVSTTNSIRTQFKTGRPKVLNDSLGKSGCLAWFPAVVLKNSTKVPAKLAYCFNNVLTILEVSSQGERLIFDSKRRWVCDESILGVQWINPSVLALVSGSQQLHLMNANTMKVTASMDLLQKHLFKHNLYNRLFAHAELLNDFSAGFKSFKGKLFFVGKYEVFIGSVPTWVDILLDLINEGRYIKAIEVATKYFVGEGDLETVGLTTDTKERHRIVLKYLVDIVKASATHVLKSDLVNIHDAELIKEFLHVSIRALVSIKAQSVVFEEIFEVFSDGHADYFFEALEPFILSSSCKTLTPVMLKEMVKYYISADKVETLEQNLCLLDIQSLDIDFTLSLLKKNKLRDSYTFIWNVLLHDYISPFLELIKEVHVQSEDSYKVFCYLAYILTGRQYPTENMIPEPDAENAKLSLYFVLFNGSPINYENGKISVDDSGDSDIAFPYLYLLAKFDSKSFLSCMNECLEDSMLNDDEIVHHESMLKLNRQFIFQILIELFSTDEFQSEDRLNFAIFIARNYPKFHQFIRLSERTLQHTLKTLCEHEVEDENTREDCELSLQSLLSVYQPPDRNELLAVFEKAGFNEILLNLYLNDKRFSEVLKVWLRLDKANSTDTTDGVLEKCFKSTETSYKERNLLEEVIEQNFSDIIESDTFKIVKILNKYAPKMHKLSLQLHDTQLKHLYLHSLVQLESQGSYKMTRDERTEYVKCLGIFDRLGLLSYIETLQEVDIDIQECISELRACGCIEAIVYLLNKDGKYEDSLDEVISYMKLLLGKLSAVVHRSDKEELDRLENDLWQQLQTGITLANHDGPQTQTTTTDRLSLNESMWLNLISFVVDELKKLDTDDSSPKSVDIVKRLLQDLFSTLINTRSQISSIAMSENDVSRTHSSFLKIFTSFLSSTSVNVTVLGDVRFVTHEIYLALSYEKNILTITSKLINDNIYLSMGKLSEKNLAGWSVLSFECDACGKIIWGRNLNSEAYTKWEERQRGEINTEDDASEVVKHGAKKKMYDLVTFNCRHCYHRSCLESLGNKDGYHCVICASKPVDA